jgi:hypothetical protein
MKYRKNRWDKWNVTIFYKTAKVILDQCSIQFNFISLSLTIFENQDTVELL